MKQQVVVLTHGELLTSVLCELKQCISVVVSNSNESKGKIEKCVFN